MNISRGTFYNWRSQYAGMTVSDVKRMKELEAENRKLKRMYAEKAIEHEALQDILEKY